MVKFLYVNGDSFAFGEELGDTDSDSRYIFTEYKRKNCYSGIIADHYSIPMYLNAARPGGSNQRIYRTLLNDISKLLGVYKPDEIFVILSITHCLRAEFHYGEDENDYWDFLAAWPPPQNSIFFALYDCLTKTYNHDYGWYHYNILMVLGIQNFLKVNNIPYLMTNSMHHTSEFIREKTLINPKVYSQLDLNRYYIEPSFMIFNNLNNYPIGKMLHPLEEGHKHWAQHLISIIDQRNLLETT